MISVVIPSYNSENTIKECLESIYRQDYSGEVEIILADSSRDSTPELVIQQFPEVKLLHFQQKTDPGSARNSGVKKSRGEVILFIDSDCIAEKSWIDDIIQRHRRFPEIAAVGGATVNGNKSGDEVGLAGYLAEFREFIPEQKPKFVDHVPTLNISYKRRIFEQYGFFDSRYYPQEDLVFNYRLIQAGEKILFDPGIRVLHRHRSDFLGYLKHQKQIGKITARVLQVLPLQGSLIAKNKSMFLAGAPLMPAVKFFKTLKVFLQHNPTLIIKHPIAILYFKIGLLYWLIGFGESVFNGKREGN
ncbi:MAG: glycosyltransferase [Calditrichia bacterium]